MSSRRADEAQNSGRKWSCRFRISRVVLTIAQNEAESHITETTTATLVAGGWSIWPQTSELWAAGRSGARPLQRGRVGASRWRTGSRRLPLPGQPWVRSESAQAGTAWARPGRSRRRSPAGWQPEGGLDPGRGPGVGFSDFLSLSGPCCLVPGPGQERARHRPAGNLRQRIYLPREFGKAQPWGSPDDPCCVLSLAWAVPPVAYRVACVWGMYLRH